MVDKKPDPDSPIGIFDSGVGGLTVMAALSQQLPAENLLYLGDTARLPYGSKSRRTVQRYSERNVDFLLRQGAKAVVLACNTASALALPALEAPVPIWGVIEPGARLAAEQARRKMAILATEATVRSGAYREALGRLRPGLEVVEQACPLFVPLVEEGWVDDAITEQVAQRYLAPLLAGGVDSLVLGCTHYPLLSTLLRRVAGEGVRVVDSAAAVAAHVAAELTAAGALRSPSTAPERRLCVTDAGVAFERTSRRILGSKVSLELVEV